ANRAGARVHLGCDRGEETAARVDAFHIPQKVVRELPQPLEPGGGSKGGLDHLLREQGACRLDRGDLELLLGAEVCEEAALAHPDGVGQPSDRESVYPDDGGELCSLTEDRVPAALAVATPSARASISATIGIHFVHRLTS